MAPVSPSISTAVFGGDPGPYIAFVTFADGSTANYALGAPLSYFAITSDLGIASIDLGGMNGAPRTDSDFAIDNLTIGDAAVVAVSVPEPAIWALMIAGFGAVGASLRRRGGKVMRPILHT